MDPAQTQRAELHVLEQALARGYLNAEQLREARGLSAPAGLLQLLAQRYLQAAHATELGQLYQQVLADPSLLADAERTMEFSAPLPSTASPPQASPPQSHLIRPAAQASAEDAGTIVTPLPSPPVNTRVLPGHAEGRPSTQPPPAGTLYAAPPGGPAHAAASPSSSAHVGPFLIVRELARGGMGVVYEAKRPGLDRRVALKQMLGGGSDDATERFLIEARIAARLRHPNIVGIHDVGESEGNPYFAMDFIEGEDLDVRIKRQGPLDIAEAARLTQVLAGALAYAHQRAVLHRDIKPANVLLSAADGEPILTDFGLAKDVEQAKGSGLTQDGAVMGTPSYMPPEQAEGVQGLIDRRADVYSLGATLYAMLVAKPPFESGTALNTLTKVLTEAVTPPRKLRPEVPRDLEVICLKCMEKEPEARYQTAQELADDLRRYLADEPILARPPSAAERLAKWVRRNRSLSAGIVVAGLLFACGTGGVWAYARSQATSQGRAQALASWRAFEAADPDDRDERIGLALTALQQGQRWVGLAPSDREARSQAYQAAVALGGVAEEGQQWALAKQAYEQASQIDPDQGPATDALLERLKGQANAEIQRRLAEVRGYLEAARAGDYLRDPLLFEEAQFGIARHTNPEVMALLLENLDAIGGKILALRCANLRSLQEPDALEIRQGQARIPGVEEVVAEFEAAATGDVASFLDDLEPASQEVLDACFARWRKRLLRQGWLREPQRVDLSKALIDEGLAGEIMAARLITLSLSRLPLPPAAVPVLIRYMNAEVDPRRQDRAGVALCRSGTKEALVAARAFHRRYKSSTPAFTAALRIAERANPAPLPKAGKEIEAHVQKLLDLQENSAALATCDQALVGSPGSSFLWTSKVRAHLALGRPKEAERAALRALENLPQDTTIRLNYLQVLLIQGRKSELRAKLADFDTARLSPQQRLSLGLLYDSVGELESAETELQLSLRAHVDYKAAALLARVMIRRGRPVDAVRFLRTYLDQDPGNPDLSVSLARAERLRGRLSQALVILNKVIEDHPGTGQAYFDRGNVHMDRGDLRAAIEDFTSALEFAEGDLDRATFLASRGVVHAKLLQPDKALPDLEEAARLAPDTAEVLSNLALFHSAQGNPVLALDVIDRALRGREQDVELLSVKGQVLARMGRKADAAALLTRVLEAQPDNVAARGNLAVTMIQVGKWKEAIVHLDHILERAPDNASALLNRSSALANLGRMDAATQDLEAVKRILPESPRPWIGEARLALARNQAAPALKAIDKAITLDARATEAYAVRGMALLRLGRVAESGAAFRLALSLEPNDVRIKLAFLNYLMTTRNGPETKKIIREILKAEPTLPEADKLKELLRQLGG